MNRIQLFGLWVLCSLVVPLLIVLMLWHLTFGAPARALTMAVAFDECGNALFGGDATETISARTGNALFEGKPWAKVVAPIIDALFGEGHCLANATLPHSS